MKRLYFIVLIILNFSLFNNTQCQIQDKPSTHYSFTNDANKFFSTSLDVLNAPFNYEIRDWNILSTIFVTSLASISLDDKIKENIQHTKSNTLNDITAYGEKFGNPIYSGILSVLIYTGGIAFKDNYIKDTGQILAEALLLNGLYSTVFKVVFGRARPFVGDGKLDFDFFAFRFEPNENSFPSGHTSTAFTFATVLSERFNNIYASIFLYSMASLTVYQRIYDNKHWFSDTLLGAALGTFIGLKVVRLYEEKEQSNGLKLSIYPSASTNNISLGVKLQF